MRRPRARSWRISTCVASRQTSTTWPSLPMARSWPVRRAQCGVVLWELQSALTSLSVPRPQRTRCLALAPGGTRVALYQDKILAVVTLRDGKKYSLAVKESHQPVAAFSPDGTLLAYSPDEEKVQLVESASGKLHASINTKEFGQVKKIIFRQDSKQVLLSTFDKVQAWDTSSRPVAQPAAEHLGNFKTAAVSPDGKALAPCRVGPAFPHAKTGKPAWTVLAHEENIDVLRFSSDGKRILTASSTSPERAVRLWNAGDGKRLAVLRFQQQPMAALFTPDGKGVLTITKDTDYASEAWLHYHDADQANSLASDSLSWSRLIPRGPSWPRMARISAHRGEGLSPP